MEFGLLEKAAENIQEELLTLVWVGGSLGSLPPYLQRTAAAGKSFAPTLRISSQMFSVVFGCSPGISSSEREKDKGS